MKGFIERQRERFTHFAGAHPYIGALVSPSPEFKDNHPYVATLIHSVPGGILAGVFCAAFFSYTVPMAAAFGGAWAAMDNSAAVGNGLVRGRTAMERRFPRVSRVVHSVGLGRLPWGGVCLAAGAVVIGASLLGATAVAALAVPVILVTAAPAFAKASVVRFKRFQLERDRIALEHAPRETALREAVVTAASAVPQPRLATRSMGAPQRSATTVAAGPRRESGFSGIG